jgi:ABC-type ATPase involved in cell division
MVFQNYALYPHMSVFDNMAYGLRIRGLSKNDIAERVKRFSDAGVDRMIVSPMHGNAEENTRTLEKLADMVGAGSPA